MELPETGNRAQMMAIEKTKKIQEWPEYSVILLLLKSAISQDNSRYVPLFCSMSHE